MVSEQQRAPAPTVSVIIPARNAGGNENSPDDMGAFVGACDLIRQETGAHLLVIHHTGKDEGRGTRGHSLLNGAADTIIEVTKDEATGLATATIKKQRDRASGDTLVFKLEPVDIGMDEDEDTITSCVVTPVDNADITETRPEIKGQAKMALRLLQKAINEAEQRAYHGGHRGQVWHSPLLAPRLFHGIGGVILL